MWNITDHELLKRLERYQIYVNDLIYNRDGSTNMICLTDHPWCKHKTKYPNKRELE
jgi:hypothetical protein